ncbi:MAG: hypothetical protein N3D82_00265 [Ignisphaera sp.]|nr:hypothetical protein [Ignisphaera sp.]MCX8167449.1 hypothetical protein [Ignisphaera sp.]MDW8084687.1 hypothetical protein [Ignisphaera sp.]
MVELIDRLPIDFKAIETLVYGFLGRLNGIAITIIKWQTTSLPLRC